MCVFLHCYFGMYLLRGISTLYAPALPRAPVCACTRSCTCGRTCAPVRLRAFPLARLGFPWRFYSAVASPRRALALGVPLLAPLGSLLGASGALPVRFLGFPARLRCLPLLRLFCALVCALVCYCVYLGYASAWLSWRSYFVRRWRYHSFILLHPASYLFFLTHMHLNFLI